MNGRQICPTLVILFIFATSLAADADGNQPLSLIQIREMLNSKTSRTEIVNLAQQRGLAFTVDKQSERRLRTYGFTRGQIRALKELALAERPPDNPQAGAGGDQGQDAAGPPGPEQPPAKRKLDPAAEAEHQRLAEQVKRMIPKSEVGLQIHPTKHINLVANKKVAATFQPQVAKLEGLIQARFSEPIATGVDPRAANIVLLETRYEYEKWVAALFAVFKEDGYQFPPNAEKQSMAGSSFFVQGIYSICLEKMDAEEAGRRVSFAVGYQYLTQLSRYRAPDSLATGFGDLAEVLMWQRPSMMLKSGYVDRPLGGVAQSWAQIVRQRFAARQVGSVQNVLAYSTTSMELPQYAEAWSLTSLLATNGKKFAELVAALPASNDVWQEIGRIYEVDEQKILEMWQRFAGQQR